MQGLSRWPLQHLDDIEEEHLAKGTEKEQSLQ